MKIINKLKFAALAATLLFQTSITRADDNEGEARDHRDANITFTKWITAFNPSPGIFANEAGIVGGDVGDGTLTGEAFSVVFLQPNVATIEGVWQFHGSKHSFTLRFQAVQTFFNNGGVITSSGVLTGVVTEGWLKGNVVAGEYTRYACPQGANGFCFDGTLEIERGSKDNH